MNSTWRSLARSISFARASRATIPGILITENTCRDPRGNHNFKCEESPRFFSTIVSDVRMSRMETNRHPKAVIFVHLRAIQLRLIASGRRDGIISVFFFLFQFYLERANRTQLLSNIIDPRSHVPTHSLQFLPGFDRENDDGAVHRDLDNAFRHRSDVARRVGSVT